MLVSKNQNLDWMIKLESIAREVALSAGCELYDLDFLGTGNGRTLRVFIDKSEGLVGIEDCTTVSRVLNQRLDTEDLIPGDNYNLEVSSPGLERDLRREVHFQAVVGKKINVKLARPLGQILGPALPAKALEATKNLTVLLLAADADGIEIEIESQKARVPWNDVDKGKLVFEFDSNEKDPAGNPNKKKKAKDHKKKRVGI